MSVMVVAGFARPLATGARCDGDGEIMTSYSIYSLSPEMDEQERGEAYRSSFLAGAARCLLDSTRVFDALGNDIDPGEPTFAEAVWWHTPRLGWELAAFEPAGRAALVERALAFVRDNFVDLSVIVAEIVRSGTSMWSTDVAYAWYRAGMIWMYSANGEGISFRDYSYSSHTARQAAERLDGVAEHNAEGRIVGITAWCHDSEYSDSSGDTMVRVEEI